eukprot:167472-Prorocentrum_minimum.AAC.1
MGDAPTGLIDAPKSCIVFRSEPPRGGWGWLPPPPAPPLCAPRPQAPLPAPASAPPPRRTSLQTGVHSPPRGRFHVFTRQTTYDENGDKTAPPAPSPSPGPTTPTSESHLTSPSYLEVTFERHQITSECHQIKTGLLVLPLGEV